MTTTGVINMDMAAVINACTEQFILFSMEGFLVFDQNVAASNHTEQYVLDDLWPSSNNGGDVVRNGAKCGSKFLGGWVVDRRQVISWH